MKRLVIDFIKYVFVLQNMLFVDFILLIHLYAIWVTAQVRKIL